MDYIKRDKNKKLKEDLIKILIFLLVFLIFILGYIVYQDIQISNENISNENIEIKRTYQTIDEMQEKNKTVTEMISDLNNCVVGISKIENKGNSIFSNENITNLGLGTGVIVEKNGYILTNAHVSGEKYSKCYVTLVDGKTYEGQVVWSNVDIDMSIVKINQKNLQEAKLGNSDNIKVGETVYAIGNPIGYEFQRTVTSGIISALNRTIKFEEENQEIYMEDLIQTDATINPGNSGGPLINIDGEVIGINGVKITSAEGISFAIPINSVKAVIDSFKNSGKFDEPSLGVFAFDNSVLGIFAILFFNMTMPITLTALSNILYHNKGMAFGLLTLALFIGAVPVFFGYTQAIFTPIGLFLVTIISLVALCVGIKKYDIIMENEE